MDRKVTCTCSRCGESHATDIYDSINVAEDATLKERVLDGSLFTWECPHCGLLNLLRYNTLYHDPAEKVMIWVTGGDAALEGQVAAMYGKVEALQAYTARFVTEPGELIEKVKLLSAGLDDVVMEMCKYVTSMEIAENDKARAAAIMEAPFKFLKMDGADNEITLAYPLEGQMQMVEIGFNVYEDCRGIVQRNPHLAASAAGFCHVDRQWLSRYISM